MIETKILGDAVGIQRQDVIDKSETTVLPSLTNGVIIGRFKRGRLDKPFTVTSENYQALLGRDPKNASYLAVEDAFKRGVSEVKIMRVGQAGGAGGDSFDFSRLPLVSGVIEFSDYTPDLASPTSNLNFAVQINGVVYNADKSKGLMEITDPNVTNIINFYHGSGSNWYMSVMAEGIHDITLMPSEQQKAYGNWFMVGGWPQEFVGMVDDYGYIDEHSNIYMRFENLA